jgi:exonuclease VII large subunit
LNVLTRGYSLTHKDSGELIRSASEVERGELLRTQVALGVIFSRVEGTAESTFGQPKANGEQ